VYLENRETDRQTNKTNRQTNKQKIQISKITNKQKQTKKRNLIVARFRSGTKNQASQKKKFNNHINIVFIDKLPCHQYDLKCNIVTSKTGLQPKAERV
jgi:hypothetical protein